MHCAWANKTRSWSGGLCNKHKKGIDERFGEAVTLCDTLINQECIEMAAHAKNLSAPSVRISFGLEISGEAVDVRPQWPASEVDERSSLFEPVF